MISDCLAPVIVAEGVGTIVTLNGREVLSEEMKFVKMDSELYNTAPGDQYELVIDDGRSRGTRKKLFVTSDACLLTPSGWIAVGDVREDKTSCSKIRVLYCRCLVCGEFAISKRPFITFCSSKCLYARLYTRGIRILPLDKNAIDEGMVREDWIRIYSIKNFKLIYGIQGVRLNSLEGANGIYVNGILVSNQKVLENSITAGYNK